jgi:hypothetical protein
VAGHRIYRAISEAQLAKYLTNCKLVIDNLEETWQGLDWKSMGIQYFAAGDSHWLA